MSDEDGYQRTIAHAMELWFEPEIRRRQASGAGPTPYPLRAAQVILYADERPNVVRLNEEVQAVGETRLKDGISKKAGDPVYAHEIEGLASIRLPDSEDNNCGHFTLVRLGDHWCLAFDFRYNKGKAAQLLEASEEFLGTASDALAHGRRRAAVDNLFSAAELAAKAYVITTPLPGGVEIKTHGRVQTRFNMFARHGNVDDEHRKVFNLLSQQRSKARYVSGDFDISIEQISGWKDDVQGLVNAVRQRVG